MSKMWILHLCWIPATGTQTLMEGKVIMLLSGKAEWDRDSDRCCHWCRGAGSDHGGRREGFPWENSKIIISGLHSALQVPYLVGEIFVLEAPDVVQTMLEKRKLVQYKQNELKEQKKISTSKHDSFSNLFHFQNQGRHWKWGYSSREPRCGHQGVALMFVFHFQNLGVEKTWRLDSMENSFRGCPYIT